IVSLEKLEIVYPVNEYKVFVALSSYKQNRIRTRLYHKIKQKGYSCANYICSTAKIWPSVKIGENCCVMDFCVAEPNAIIGDNVTLFHGTFIGHNSSIGNNCWIVCSVISGLVIMGENCFIGANSAIADSIVMEDDCFVTIGSAVNKNCSKGGIYAGNPARKRKVNVYRMFKIPEKS
ncbi:MAG TPA: sugar O-acyltransferase, partial [Saprospiraceae bacterium]|nr:sugar O-acyltransferase [Saprospiraceae bacterium]